jgi:tRNA threonylcarbamoyladenosine biosynthesis protein TsaE
VPEHRFDVAGPDETRALGKALGRAVAAGDLIGLVGDLGAGKTLLVQALARGLGLPDVVPVVSPTFTLVNEYDGGRAPLFHADLYRIERERELEELGLEEMCREGEGVVVIEWSDRFPVLPPDHLGGRFEINGDSARALNARSQGPRSDALLAAWLAEVAL